MTAISKINSYHRTFKHERVHQWDIFKDVNISYIVNKNEKIDANYPYIVVMTQDCDLLQDYNNRKDASSQNKDKYLINLLICPAFPSDSLVLWTHLEWFPRRKLTETEVKELPRNDKFKRYHFLNWDKAQWIPDLIIDFKLFLTLDRDEAYSLLKNNFVSSIEELFRDSLMQRFANFLSRIPLPILEESKE